MHAAVARSTFLSQNAKKLTVLVIFWKLGCGKWHSDLARSRFASQNAKKLRVLAHFWKLRCRKMARGCSEQLNMLKNSGSRTTFRSSDVEKWHAAEVRSTFPTQNVKNMKGSGHLFEVELSKNCGSWHVQNLHAAVARSTFATHNVQNTACSRHFLKKR